jgi:hypothetical protein
MRSADMEDSAEGALVGHYCFIPFGTSRLTRIAQCRPEGRLTADKLDILPRHHWRGFPGINGRTEWFAIELSGKFKVTKTGDYVFRLESDDGSILWIDREKVINNDGAHAPLSRWNTIHLTEGNHRIEVFYFQGAGPAFALQLFVKPPGERERLWTAVL